MTPEERIAETIEAIHAALKRRREVLRLERAFGSSEVEASESAATAYMLDIAEQHDRLLSRRR